MYDLSCGRLKSYQRPNVAVRKSFVVGSNWSWLRNVTVVGTVHRQHHQLSHCVRQNYADFLWYNFQWNYSDVYEILMGLLRQYLRFNYFNEFDPYTKHIFVWFVSSYRIYGYIVGFMYSNRSLKSTRYVILALNLPNFWVEKYFVPKLGTTQISKLYIQMLQGSLITRFSRK